MKSISCTPYQGLKGVGRETPVSFSKSAGYVPIPTPYRSYIYTLPSVGTAAAYWLAASSRHLWEERAGDVKSR